MENRKKANILKILISFSLIVFLSCNAAAEAPIELTAEEIEVVPLTPAGETFLNGDVLPISVSAWDMGEAGMASVTVDVSAVNETVGIAVLAYSGGYWVNNSVIVDTFNTGTLPLPITAIDNLGNENTNETLTVYKPTFVHYVPAEFPEIQAAVDAANNSDKIIVNSGTYLGMVSVDKPGLVLRGVDTGNGRPVIIGYDATFCIQLTADNCTVEGFNVTDAQFGIDVLSSNNTISNNNAYLNDRWGFRLLHSNNNTFTDNTAKDSRGNGFGYGFFLSFSDYNNFEGNTANGNNYGFYLDYSDYIFPYDGSDHNNFEGNTANGNNYGFVLERSNLNDFTINTANGNNYGFVLGVSSNYNNLTGNTANYNRNDDGEGVGFFISPYWGASESGEESDGNNLIKNTACGNNYGIECESDTYENWIYHNVICGNDYNAFSYGNGNHWNSSEFGNYYDDVYYPYVLTETGSEWINTTQEDADWADWGEVADNNYSEKLPIGFDFTLAGVTYTHMQIVSNGVIQLIPEGGVELNDSGYEGKDYWIVSYPDETFIFALCDDLLPASDGEWYGYRRYSAGDLDSEGNEIPTNLAVIDYHLSTYSDGWESEVTTTNSFQVVLYENGTLRFNFKDINYIYTDADVYSGLYLGNDSSVHAKETIHVAKDGEYDRDKASSYITPISRVLSSTYDAEGDGIADSPYKIGESVMVRLAGSSKVTGSHELVGSRAPEEYDYLPLVLASKALSPATASGTGTFSFTVNTDIIDHADVGIEKVELYWKKGSGDWSKYGESSTGTFTFSTSEAGDYYFYTVATDVYGNIEGLPDSYDSHTSVSLSSGSSGSGGSGGSGIGEARIISASPENTENVSDEEDSDEEADGSDGSGTLVPSTGNTSTDEEPPASEVTKDSGEEGDDKSNGAPGFGIFAAALGLVSALYMRRN